MKRLFYIFLISIYTLLSTGFVANAHSCAGVLQEFSRVAHTSGTDACPICKQKNKDQKEKKKDCCKHQNRWIKISDNVQKTAVSHFNFKLWADELPVRQLGAVFDFKPIFFVEKSIIHSLPDRIYPFVNTLYIFHCTYRI